MRNVMVSKEQEEYLNVWYDAVTKQQDPGGMVGLRKINKLIDLFDSVGRIRKVSVLCQECAKDLGATIDKYTLNVETPVDMWMDDDLWSFIKASYDKVTWSPMKAKLITDSFDYLDGIKESKPTKVD